jgi:hypothetical protein
VTTSATRVDAEQVLCRFHLTTGVHHGATPLYAWIVQAARRDGLQGATVLEGFYGLSLTGAVLSESAWSITQDRPVIVEVVDRASRIEALLAAVEPAFRSGLITLERAHVRLYRASGDAPVPSPTAIDIVATEAASTAHEVRTMTLPDAGVLLRVFIGENDREPETHRPLYEAIVRRAREAGLAGATVLRGPMGFGRHSRVHTARLLELSTDLPIVIEIVDAEDRIQAFLPQIDALVTEGLVTLESVRVLRYVSPDTQ